MEKNHNIDIIRAVALLLVLIYHFWVKMNIGTISIKIIEDIVMLGGEVGVTAFFLLSGYGIYYSLQHLEKDNNLSFKVFMKRRIERIIPQYYLNLIVVLLFTGSAVYLDKSHLWDILLHFALLHNVCINFAGTINGVLWTMAVIFQFYLIAIPLYKALNKWGYSCIWTSIIITILCKIGCFHIVINLIAQEENYMIYAFWLGRNLLCSVLDNFVIGMGIAFFIENNKKKFKKPNPLIGCMGAILLLGLFCRLGRKYGIHTDNVSGYLWHSGIAICIGLIILFSYYIRCKHKNILSKILLFLSKYEYGIYLWHLIMIDNLILNAPIIKRLILEKYYILVGIIWFILSVVIGVIFTKLTDKKNIRFWFCRLND